MRVTTERMLLRELTLDDEACVHVYASDPEVTRYTDWGPNTREQTRAHVAASSAPTSPDPDRFLFAVTVRGSSRVIGSAELRIESREHRRADFGYVFARDVWGHGYATEAAQALRSLAFEQLGMHRLSATCHPDNVASARVLEKTGLVLEGRLRDHLWVRGGWRDSLLYAVLNPSV